MSPTRSLVSSQHIKRNSRVWAPVGASLFLGLGKHFLEEEESKMHLRKVSILGVILSLAVAAAACSSVKYNSDFDPAIDFEGMSTYAWLEAADPSQANRGVDELTERRIITALENQLDAKGYRRATTGTPDLLVNFYLTTEQKMDVSTYSTGWGYYGWYGGTQTTVHQWTEGTLVVDLVDVAEKDLAWRGWAQGELHPNLTPEERTRRVNEVIDGIMRQFPPKK
jgi:hypothetical protein